MSKKTQSTMVLAQASVSSTQTTKETELLFVYGSLLRQGKFALLEMSPAQAGGAVTLVGEGTLNGCGLWVLPAGDTVTIAPQRAAGASAAKGEVYWVGGGVISALDRLEDSDAFSLRFRRISLRVRMEKFWVVAHCYYSRMAVKAIRDGDHAYQAIQSGYWPDWKKG